MKETPEWVLAGSGRALLEVEKRETFFYYVRRKYIRARKGTGKRDTLYNRDDILAVKHMREKRNRVHAVGATDWVQISDLPSLVALDYEMYGELTVESSVTQHWWRKNPTACRILFNAEDRKEIWGAISIIPMQLETIMKLVRGEMEERQIAASDILTYEEGGEYDVYVPSAVIHPDHLPSLRKLVSSVLDFWCEQHPRIRFRRVYAFASSDDGLRLARYLYFSHRPDIGENVFALDPYSPNPSPLMKQFQRCVKSKDA